MCAVNPKSAFIGAMTTGVRLNRRRVRFGQHGLHCDELLRHLSLPIDDERRHLVDGKQSLQIDFTALVQITGIDMHEAGLGHIEADPQQHVSLNREIIEVHILHSAGRFHFDQPPSRRCPVRDRDPFENINTHHDPFIFERAFENGGYPRVFDQLGSLEDSRFSLPNRWPDHNSARESSLCQHTNFRSHGKDGLRRRIGRRGQFRPHDFEIQPLVTLQS